MSKKLILIVLLIFSFTSFNVYGAGTVTLDRGTMDRASLNEFQPNEESSLVLWLNGSDTNIMTLDGSNRCSQWNDNSDNGNHVTQSVENSQPVFIADQQNGLGSLLYSADLMLVNPNGIDFSTPMYIGAVVKTDAINTKKTFIDFNDVFRIFHNDTTGYHQLQRPLDTTNLDVLDDTDYHVVVIEIKTNNTLTGYFDRIAFTDTDVDDMTGQSMTTIGIGGRIGGGGAFTGAIGELLVFQPASEFSANEILDIREYLLDKWGI